MPITPGVPSVALVTVTPPLETFSTCTVSVSAVPLTVLLQMNAADAGPATDDRNTLNAAAAGRVR